MKTIQCAGLFAAAVLGVATSAQAANVPVTKANGTFIAGSGIPGDNFTVATSNGLSVALKARGRDTGQPLSQVGSKYYVAAGTAAGGSNPWWNFDFQFTPGAGDQAGSPNYIMTLHFDTDASAGTDFITISRPIIGGFLGLNGWAGGFLAIGNDGLFTNPGGGAWSDGEVDYVYSQSWRSNMSFLAGSILDDGEYTIALSVSDVTGNVLVGTDITVIVGAGSGVIVPLPTGAGLGLAGLLVVATRRRR